MPFGVSSRASEVKFTVEFSSICVIRWPSVRNLYNNNNHNNNNKKKKKKKKKKYFIS